MTKLCKSWREPQGISVLCFVPVQRQSETPPRSLRLDCHRAVDLPIKVLKSHAKTEYLLRMALVSVMCVESIPSRYTLMRLSSLIPPGGAEARC